MDNFSEARLAEVNPVLSQKIHTMADMAAQEGIIFRVTQGLRTWQQQDALYQQGRTTPGKVVTNAQAGHSWHNLGLAVDIVPLDQEPPQPDWNVQHPQWQRLIAIGESLGLTAGAEFRTFPDTPHFQLTGVWPVSPNDEARQTFLDGGIQAVWDEAKLA